MTLHVLKQQGAQLSHSDHENEVEEELDPGRLAVAIGSTALNRLFPDAVRHRSTAVSSKAAIAADVIPASRRRGTSCTWLRYHTGRGHCDQHPRTGPLSELQEPRTLVMVRGSG
jgi:hypothetical protein